MEYGDIKEIRIIPGSSGTNKIVIETELLNRKALKRVIEKLMKDIRAPVSVEA